MNRIRILQLGLLAVMSLIGDGWRAEAGEGDGAAERQRGIVEPAWESLFDGKTLKNWKATNFGGEANVTVKDGRIVMESGHDMTGITYTGKPPTTNYEVALEGMRLDGSDFFCSTTFPVGNGHCTLVAGGWGGAVVGLSNIDAADASDNETTRFQDFKDKRWYRVRIRVTDAKITCWIDGKPVVQVERKGHEFDVRPEVELSKPLGICTWQTTGAIRNIRLRRLTSAEQENGAVKRRKE